MLDSTPAGTGTESKRGAQVPADALRRGKGGKVSPLLMLILGVFSLVFWRQIAATLVAMLVILIILGAIYLDQLMNGIFP